MLQREGRLSHAEVTVRTKTEKNERKFTESLTNEVQNVKLGMQDSKSTEKEKQKQVGSKKRFGPKKTVQENITLLI